MPKNKIQNEKVKEKRRNEIIVTATKIFAFNNYSSVTIDDITNQLKCSHGLFYHYFENKEDLFIVVMKEAIEVAKKHVYSSAKEETCAIEQIRSIVRTTLRITQEKNEYHVACLYLLFNLRLQVNDVPQKEECRASCVAATDKMVQLIAEAQRDGAAYDDDAGELVLALVSLLKGLFFNRIMVGHQKFICPDPQIIMRLVEKQDGEK